MIKTKPLSHHHAFLTSDDHISFKLPLFLPLIVVVAAILQNHKSFFNVMPQYFVNHVHFPYSLDCLPHQNLPSESDVSTDSTIIARMSVRSSQPSRPPGAGESESISESTVNTNSPASIPSCSFKTVWDFEKVTKIDDDNCLLRRWHCGWCDCTFKSWNATKALAHVTKSVGKNDIKPCSGSIPKTTLDLFKSFRFQKIGAATVKRQWDDAYTDRVADNQQSMSVMFQAGRVRSSNSASSNSSIIDMTADGGGGGVEATNATRLTTAIADFVYCKGLPFSITEGEHFRQILKLSKLVSNTYIPPSLKTLANELLDVSYDMQQAKYLSSLEVDADVYGLSLFGDGATVHGMPLMNILASGVEEPSAVLAIVDCKLCCMLFCISFLTFN